MGHRRTSGKDWIRESTRQAIYLRDGSRCIACGDGPDDGATLSLDHIEGPSNHPTNLVTMCGACNSSRRNATVLAWAGAAFLSHARASATPLTRELRRAGLERAKALRPERHAKDVARGRARRLNAKRPNADELDTDAPF